MHLRQILLSCLSTCPSAWYSTNITEGFLGDFVGLILSSESFPLKSGINNILHKTPTCVYDTNFLLSFFIIETEYVFSAVRYEVLEAVGN